MSIFSANSSLPGNHGIILYNAWKHDTWVGSKYLNPQFTDRELTQVTSFHRKDVPGTAMPLLTFQSQLGGIAIA